MPCTRCAIGWVAAPPLGAGLHQRGAPKSPRCYVLRDRDVVLGRGLDGRQDLGVELRADSRDGSVEVPLDAALRVGALHRGDVVLPGVERLQDAERRAAPGRSPLVL